MIILRRIEEDEILPMQSNNYFQQLFRFIIADIVEVLPFLPAALIIFAIVMLIMYLIFRGLTFIKPRDYFFPAAIALLISYSVFVLFITFLSRPAGSRTGVDLVPFSIMGKSVQGDAWVVENVLLFVPFGLLFPYICIKWRTMAAIMKTGALLSCVIEISQFVTKRGHLQIDDVITNVLGIIIGFLLFQIMDWYRFIKFLCKKTRFLCIIMVTTLSLQLSGCRLMHYNRADARAYLDEQFPGENIHLSMLYHKENDDRYWDCYFKDSPEMIFHVISMKEYTIYTDYYLGCDIKKSFWQYYLNQYIAEFGSMDQWEMESDGDLNLYYSDKETAMKAEQQLLDFLKWYQQQPRAKDPLSVRCYLKDMEFPIAYIDDRVLFIENGDDSYSYDALAEVCEKVLMQYYNYYRIESDEYPVNIIETYAEAEWGWESKDYPYPTAMYQKEQLLSGEIFSGIGIYASHVSYAGLYEMLKRLDITVAGRPEHYTVTGMDGRSYEFAYSLKEEIRGNTGWYYYCDREKISNSSNAPVISIKSELFTNITGIRVEDKTSGG